MMNMNILKVSMLLMAAIAVVSAENEPPYGSTIELLVDVTGTDIRFQSVKFDPMDPDRLLLSGASGIYSLNPITGEMNHIHQSNMSVTDIMFINKNDFYVIHFSCIMNGTRSTQTEMFEATLMAGNCSHAAYVNGPFLESRFNKLRKIKSYGDNKLLVLDRRNSELRVADLETRYMTEAFSMPSLVYDFTDDPLSEHHIYLVNRHMLVHYDMRDASTRIVAGSSEAANVVGSGGEARFENPWSVFTLNTRDLIVIDRMNGAIKLVQDYHTASSIVSSMHNCTNTSIAWTNMGILGMNGFYVVDTYKLFYIPQTKTQDSARVTSSTFIRDSTACSRNLEFKPHIISSSVIECANHCTKMSYCTAFQHFGNSCYIEPSGITVTGGVAENNCFRRVLL